MVVMNTADAGCLTACLMSILTRNAKTNPNCSHPERSSGAIETNDRNSLLYNEPGYVSSKCFGRVRSHWAIENAEHWQLDVSFNEDASKIHERTATKM